jgi:predicted Zn-dependent protease
LLSRDEFDALEYDAACTGDHQTAALRMSELADTGTETATMPRSEAYLRAGEQWLLADDPAQAATGFRRAMADGGPVFADARVPLARALFQLGRQAEAQALISRLKAEGPKDARVCDLVAELLLERNDLIGALDWATAGVELCLGRAVAMQPSAQPAPPRTVPLQVVRGDDAELRLLLSLRYRIRNDLGLPEDSYDELLDDND